LQNARPQRTPNEATTTTHCYGARADSDGARHRATGPNLRGHQVGAFIGALLGGAVYDRTGSYDPIWVLCIALSVAAAVVHLPTHEQRAPQPSLA
jgi:predicted MFS family arabinose efflux permease